MAAIRSAFPLLPARLGAGVLAGALVRRALCTSAACRAERAGTPAKQRARSARAPPRKPVAPPAALGPLTPVAEIESTAAELARDVWDYDRDAEVRSRAALSSAALAAAALDRLRDLQPGSVADVLSAASRWLPPAQLGSAGAEMLEDEEEDGLTPPQVTELHPPSAAPGSPSESSERALLQQLFAQAALLATQTDWLRRLRGAELNSVVKAYSFALRPSSRVVTRKSSRMLYAALTRLLAGRERAGRDLLRSLSPAELTEMGDFFTRAATSAGVVREDRTALAGVLAASVLERTKWADEPVPPPAARAQAAAAPAARSEPPGGGAALPPLKGRHPRRRVRFTPMQQSRLLWAFTRVAVPAQLCGPPDAPTLEQTVRAAPSRAVAAATAAAAATPAPARALVADDDDDDDEAHVAAAAADAAVTCRELVEFLHEQLASSVHALPPARLAATAWAAASNGVPAPALLQAIGGHMPQRVRELRPRQQVTLLWALCCKGYLPRELTTALVDALNADERDAPARGLKASHLSQLHNCAACLALEGPWHFRPAPRLRARALRSARARGAEAEDAEADAHWSWGARTRVPAARASSLLHRRVSACLRSLGVPHANEAVIGALQCSVDILVGDGSAGVIVEVLGPSHFAMAGTELAGGTELKLRLLRLEGWRVITVPYYEWGQLRSDGAEREYLVGKLNGYVPLWLSDLD